MSEPLILNKMSLVVTTRCNLRCKLCDEFIPQNRPFPDMTVEEEKRILDALFEVADRVKLLHLSGGGEPFLNPSLAKMADAAFEYEDRFERLMTFTNSTVLPSDRLLDAFARHKERMTVQASDYGIMPERSGKIHEMIRETGVTLRINKYYGEDQDFGGWVDFGPWESQGRTDEARKKQFADCGITKHMHGNWRTRDGKCHWCQRSQRGMELGILADYPDDYVDLFSDHTAEEKREKFRKIMAADCLYACDFCSGDHGTQDMTKRFRAGEQLNA